MRGHGPAVRLRCTCRVSLRAGRGLRVDPGGIPGPLDPKGPCGHPQSAIQAQYARPSPPADRLDHPGNSRACRPLPHGQAAAGASGTALHCRAALGYDFLFAMRHGQGRWACWKQSRAVESQRADSARCDVERGTRRDPRACSSANRLDETPLSIPPAVPGSKRGSRPKLAA